MQGSRLRMIFLVLVALASVAVSEVHRIPIKRTETNILGHSLQNGPPRQEEIVKIHKHNHMFLGHLSVSVPAKTYLVNFNTRSGNLWLFSKEASPKIKRVGGFKHTDYDRTKSVSILRYNQVINKHKQFTERHLFHRANYTGVMALETIRLGETVLEDTPFAYMTDMNDVGAALGDGFDGSFGLGLEQLGENKATPTFIDMCDENKFDEPVFSFYFSKDKHTGTVLFGGTDQDLYSGSLHSVPIVGDKGFWQIHLEHVKIESNMFTRGIHTFAHMDSVGEYISAPSGVVEEIAEVLTSVGAIVETGGGVSIGCEKRRLLPSLEFMINSRPYSFSGAEYFTEGSDGVCRMLLTSHGSNIWYLGRPFLEKYYTIFDVHKEELRIARANHGK